MKPLSMEIMRRSFSIFLFLLFSVLGADAQTITAEALKKYANWPRFAQISRFYQLNGNQPAWTADTSRQQELLALIKLASSIGLNEADYQTGMALKKTADSIEGDVRFTDAAIHFFSEVKGGKKLQGFGYNGLNYSPDLSEVVPALKKHLDAGKLKELFFMLQPRSKEYAFMLGKLGWFQRLANRHDFQEARITSAVADSTNQSLLVRLYQLGITDSILTTVDKKTLQSYIKAAQRSFDLVEDGVAGRATLKALNVPLYQRIEELKLALNALRWLEDIKQTGNVLLLNLPSANFLVYEKGKIALGAKVVAGKPATPSPTLASTITEVILYPYWNVTYNIATKELLPHIKRDIGYLAKNNYQVLNRQGKVLNPYSINWQALSPAYFPYLIRQSTGCDNSLGIVKFNFYNPFTVYLHDTPAKSLFASKKRFYSHGCMRVEKPVELARFLLGFNRIAIDTLTAKGCLSTQAPITVRLENPLPVIVVYNTVWYDREGNIHFYDDVYKKLNGLSPQKVASQKEDGMPPRMVYQSAKPSVHQ